MRHGLAAPFLQRVAASRTRKACVPLPCCAQELCRSPLQLWDWDDAATPSPCSSQKRAPPDLLLARNVGRLTQKGHLVHDQARAGQAAQGLVSIGPCQHPTPRPGATHDPAASGAAALVGGHARAAAADAVAACVNAGASSAGQDVDMHEVGEGGRALQAEPPPPLPQPREAPRPQAGLCPCQPLPQPQPQQQPQEQQPLPHKLPPPPPPPQQHKQRQQDQKQHLHQPRPSQRVLPRINMFYCSTYRRGPGSGLPAKREFRRRLL